MHQEGQMVWADAQNMYRLLNKDWVPLARLRASAVAPRI